MPSGGPARGPPPKRETFRPPWVKGGEDNGEITKPSSISGGKPKTIVRPKKTDNNETTSAAKTPAANKAPEKAETKPTGNSAASKMSSVDDDKPRGVLRKQTKIKEGGENGVSSEPKAAATTKSKLSAKDEPAPASKDTSKDGLPPRRPTPSVPRQPSRDDVGVKKWRDPLRERVKDNIDKTLANDAPEGHTLTPSQSMRSLLKPAPPPMPPPLPPKAPPPPEFSREPLSVDKLKKLEALKSRPRRRPDWSDMMKEVESGKKLKHIVCDDRSSPVITRASVVKTKEGTKDKFVFESEEKEPAHNELLKQIEKGIRLKKTKTNDRSKPNLDGLRKFRRQMTIEEQIQKSQSQANLSAEPGIKEAPPEEEEIDEMDDIDRVRDDLQSTKQLLALELRNKDAQARENKLLQKRIENLSAELAKERAIIKQAEAKTVISVTDAYDDKLVTSLKDEVSNTKTVAADLEKMYHQTAEQLDETKSALEEALRKNAELEKRLQQAMATVYGSKDQEDEPESFYAKRQKDFAKQCQLLGVDSYNTAALKRDQRRDDVRSFWADDNDDDEEQGHFPASNQSSRRSSHAIKQMSVRESSFEEEESESDDEGEETEEKKQKKLEKEVKTMKAKLKHLDDKKARAKKEREGLKVQLKSQQQALRAERKKYKELKREVDKMAAMMKEVGDGGDEDEDEDDESQEEETKKEEPETSEEEDTETEQETESETESESEPEDAPLPKKKDNLSSRVKKHESALTALKKGNALLLANVDRLKDDVNKQKEESATMQSDLDSLLAELEC